jgi:hypothetical protein
METAFVSIVCVALMVIGGMTMSQGFLSSVDTTTSNIQVLSQRDESIMRTNIEVLEATQTSANLLKVTLRNCGQTKMAEFEKWDIIVHTQKSAGQPYVTWLPYNSGLLAANEWNIEGIYRDAFALTPEAFEPGILNPDEEVMLQCKLDPAVGPGTVNLVSITTPNGVTVSKAFDGYTP